MYQFLYSSYYSSYSSSDDSHTAIIVLSVLFGLFFGFLISYLIANAFYEIACQKGHTDRKFFHFCFWLGIVGYIMVAALPDRGMQKISVSETTTAPSSPSEELPEL